MVLELSSFQLMTMKKPRRRRRDESDAKPPGCAPGSGGVQRRQKEYPPYQGPADVAVLNYDNAVTRDYAGLTKAEVRFFSRSSRQGGGVYLEDGSFMTMPAAEKARS